MAVRVVTDSTCDLPPETVQALGITVVPLWVRFGQEAFRDRVDIDPIAFFERLVAGPDLPKTSQPSVEEFREVYEALGQSGDEIVSIHVSSRLSGTLNSASIAREDVTRGVRIELIDSYTVSLGLGAIVVEAAERAMAGGTLKEVEQTARHAMDRNGLAAAFASLEYLQKGGRVGRARALAGSLLNIKPILALEDGEVAARDRVRTWRKAIDRLADIAMEHRNARRLYVACATNVGEAETLVERLRPAMPHTEFQICRFGPVLGVYSGPVALGITWLDRDY